MDKTGNDRDTLEGFSDHAKAILGMPDPTIPPNSRLIDIRDLFDPIDTLSRKRVPLESLGKTVALIPGDPRDTFLVQRELETRHIPYYKVGGESERRNPNDFVIDLSLYYIF